MLLTLQDQSGRFEHITSRFDRLESKVDDTNSQVRSLEQGFAEIKDLLIQALDK